jgi:hypothetical protein
MQKMVIEIILLMSHITANGKWHIHARRIFVKFTHFSKNIYLAKTKMYQNFSFVKKPEVFLLPSHRVLKVLPLCSSKSFGSLDVPLFNYEVLSCPNLNSFTKQLSFLSFPRRSHVVFMPPPIIKVLRCLPSSPSPLSQKKRSWVLSAQCLRFRS